ncbi:MAG: cob(I)yrinic acid a,c-diamide adenosyltransferase [Bacteroidales bacterium]|nr:cob(I)yrinic acid a,c-diamide adenosyltransferase [Bacteroidales bacterium]
MTGKVQGYTGNGKGKTTAALGLALRASGAGLKVFIGQFVKGMHYHEPDTLEHLPNISLKQYGLDCFIVNEPMQNDIDAAKKGFTEMLRIVMEGKYDLVIFDEINIALYYKLIEIDELLDLINRRPAHVELVLTGRYAPGELLDLADLVTEIREVKHYYQDGVEARKGIEY